jgi:hypothetical protein
MLLGAAFLLSKEIHMAAMSNYLESGLIGHIFRGSTYTAPTTLYIGLVGKYDSGNLESGLYTDEISGASYARVSGGPDASLWNAYTVSAEGTANTNTLTFPAATSNWGYVSGVFIADGSGTSNNLLLYGALSTPKNVTNGDTFSFGAGDLDIYFR